MAGFKCLGRAGRKSISRHATGWVTLGLHCARVAAGAGWFTCLVASWRAEW